MKNLQTRKEPEYQQRAKSYEKMKKKFEDEDWSDSSEEEEERIKAIPKQLINDDVKDDT